MARCEDQSDVADLSAARCNAFPLQQRPFQGELGLAEEPLCPHCGEPGAPRPASQRRRTTGRLRAAVSSASECTVPQSQPR